VSRPFAGFSIQRESAVLVPPELLTDVLAEVQDVAELKVLLTVFRLVAAQKDRPQGEPRAVSWDALRQDRYLGLGLTGLGPEMTPAERLDRALERCVVRGTLLHLVVQRGGHAESYYLLNTAANRQSVEEMGQEAGPLSESPGEEAEPAGVFRLYEQNIGVVTPLLAEELAEAAGQYPADWFADAFREAVGQNRRSWRYVRAILERWQRDGRGGRPGRGTETIDWDRYKSGKYAHLFQDEPEEPGEE
jgi:DnaD/phage-associated family protein